MGFTQVKKGKVIGALALKNQFDKDAARVLGESLEPMPKKKGERARYKVLKDLPASKGDYNDLKRLYFTTKVETLVEDANGEIESLADEMREAFDNTPESLQQGDVGSRRGEAADALENLRDDVPEMPEKAKDVSAVFVSDPDATSRPRRASEAASMLTTAEALREHADEGPDLTADERQELRDYADELDNRVSELEGVDFPGMFG